MAEKKISKTHAVRAPKHVAEVKKGKYIEGVGRRKTSVARVRIIKTASEAGKITVNQRSLENYFTLQSHQKIVRSPLERIGAEKSFAATVKVAGGGISSQAEAVRHGLARALVAADETLRKKLKHFGFLTRDPRMVERKKYGLKKARKAPQWSKR